ncbi:olfactory receptor 51G2-like isoform X2 [Phaenicophaeus curvirostris]|uniref:olfactory receptor 51G2-like isoform X2 n=1 Tax=Phaenicophaeus curvirostris TaxID=33595 RepID=UPI0037F0FA2E
MISTTLLGQLLRDEMEHPCFIPPGTNRSQSRTLSFLLGGFPAWETTRMWSAVPLCSMYLLALLGNLAVLAIVGSERSLHAPMYLLLAMLAVADLGLSTSTFPTMLRMLWLEAREISFGTCLAQMFFIHVFADIESAVILAMAFDRYVAICHPLRVRRLSHPYCLHPDVIKHAESDVRVHSTYGLFVLLSTLGLDLLFVLLSYLLILKTILSVATWRGRLKALNTCLSHICAVLLFFIPMICLSMMHQFIKHVSPQAYTFTANLHFLVPPILNPIVYSVKAKPIRRRMLRMLCQSDKARRGICR